MEPKKEIKNHYLIKPKSKWLEPLTQEELISRINEISEQIHRSSRIGPANFMVMGPHAAEQLDEVMREYRKLDFSEPGGPVISTTLGLLMSVLNTLSRPIIVP